MSTIVVAGQELWAEGNNDASSVRLMNRQASGLPIQAITERFKRLVWWHPFARHN